MENLLKVEHKRELETEILDYLLDEENLDVKTEIERPLLWAQLDEIANFLLSNSFTQSSNTIKSWMHQAKKYYVSHDRKGRIEMVESLHRLQEAKESGARTDDL